MQVGLELSRRHHGMHKLVKGIMIDLDVNSAIVATAQRIGAGINLDYLVDEEDILSKIPKRWLPVKPEQILLIVGDENGGTAVRSPKRFQDWGKYFDAYSLTISVPSDILEKIDYKAREKVVADENDRKARIALAKGVHSGDWKNEPLEEKYEYVWSYWEHALAIPKQNLAYLNGQILRDLEERGYPKSASSTRAALDEIRKRRKAALSEGE